MARVPRLACLLLSLTMLLLVPRSSAAQAPDGPAEQPAAPPAPPAPATDTADVVAAYDVAFGALLGGNLERARDGFRTVAARSVEPERRAAAAELARLADELVRRGAKLQSGGPSVTAAPPAVKLVSEDDQPDAGRTSFIVTTTLAGTYSGVVLLDVLDTDDFRPGVLIVTATTAAGFLGSLYGSRGKRITGGMADAYSLGIGLGVGNGLLLAFPLGIDGESEDVQTFALAAMAIGGTAGLVASDRVQPTRAQVGLAGTTAILGIATTGLGLGLIQPDVSSDTILLLLAGGLDVGAALGLGLGADIDWSVSRQRLTSLGAFLGAFAGWAGAALITGADPDSDDDTARAWSASTLAGMWGGFALSTYLTRDMKPDPRFRNTAPAPAPMVMPTRIRDAPGIAFGGSF